MPFKSQAQWKYCRAAQARGEHPEWDCSKWAHESPPYRELPIYVEKKAKKPKKVVKISTVRVFTGPRGGKYRLVGGKKVYLK